MTFRQITFTLFSLIVAFSVLQVDGAEEIRLCGRRLADILRYVCERRGGFHTPRVRRDGKSILINLFYLNSFTWTFKRH